MRSSREGISPLKKKKKNIVSFDARKFVKLYRKEILSTRVTNLPEAQPLTLHSLRTGDIIVRCSTIAYLLYIYIYDIDMTYSKSKQRRG